MIEGLFFWAKGFVRSLSRGSVQSPIPIGGWKISPNGGAGVAEPVSKFFTYLREKVDELTY